MLQEKRGIPGHLLEYAMTNGRVSFVVKEKAATGFLLKNSSRKTTTTTTLETERHTHHLT
jgi:hypothetical protein